MHTPSQAPPKPERAGSRLRHLGVLSALLLLAYLSYAGTFTSFYELIISTHIEPVARAYIKTTLHETTRTLETLSATKAALALLQSSSGGISFIVDVQIQLGQLLNAIVEFIDRAWYVSLGAVVAVEGLGLLLDLSKLSMAPVLTLFFVTLGMAYGLQRRAPRPAHAISHMARMALFVALVVHFVIPLTIYVTATAGHFFFHEQKAVIQQGFESVHAATPKHEPGIGLHDEVKSVINKFKHSQGSMLDQTTAISRLTGSHILLSIAEHLVVPLIFFTLFWVVFRHFLDKLWSGQASGSLPLH